jgi:hypothetical protein
VALHSHPFKSIDKNDARCIVERLDQMAAIYEALPASLTTLMKVPPNALVWNRDPSLIFGATVCVVEW